MVRTQASGLTHGHHLDALLTLLEPGDPVIYGCR